ncbi:hypothetical protein GCM10020219_095300 [Nonomuraea dietziae]
MPSEPSRTLSIRWVTVHSEPMDSGILPLALTFSNAAMNSSIVLGAAATPASFRTLGLNHRMFDLWMLTGTE